MAITRKLKAEKKAIIESCAAAQSWLNDMEKGGDSPELLVEAIERVVAEWEKRNMEIDQMG